MDIYSIIFVAGLGVSVILGYLLGFGKTVKFCTGGIIKHIIAIWFCFTFGGIIASLPIIGGLIEQGNAYFGQFAQILEKINVATILFYVALFILVEIVRWIIVILIRKVFEPKKKDGVIGGVRNIINRVLGALLFGAFWLLLVWVLLGAMKVLTDVEAVSAWVDHIASDKASRLIYGLYKFNPIDFWVLLK